MNKQTENTIEEIGANNRAKRFAEWCSSEDWYYHIDGKFWFQYGNFDGDKTTSELLEEFDKENK